LLTSFAGGLLLLGAQLTSPMLLVAGVLFVVAAPAILIVWRFRWRDRP